MKKLIYLFAFVMMLSFASALTEVANETVGGLDSQGDVDNVTITATSLSDSGYIRDVGIMRGDGTGWSRFRVNISQGGITLATKTGLITDTPSMNYYVNFTQADYSQVINKSDFQIIIDVENGSIKFQQNSSYTFGGSLFSFTNQPFPATQGTTVKFTSLTEGAVLNTPTNNQNILSNKTQLFNFTAPLLDNDWVNASLYINGTLNETILITGLTNTSTFSKSFSDLGLHNWTVILYNNQSTKIITITYDFNVTNYIEDSLVFPASALIGDFVTFNLTSSLTSSLSITSANLIYNGTTFSASINSLGNNHFSMIKTLTIPEPDGTIGFFFNLGLSDGSTINTTLENITVNPIGIDNCSVYTNELYNFTMYDEQSQATLNGATDVTNASLNIQVYSLGKTEQLQNYSNTYELTNPFRVCLQNSLTAVSEFVIDVELQYKAKGYATEFYNILGDTLDITDANTSIPLYSLENVSSQDFKIIYRDASFLPVPDAVIQIQRRYIGEGVFKNVEQPKTDINGETLAHLELNEVIYNFIILEDNVITATFNNVIAICQNPVFNNCEISLTNTESFIETTDFTNLGDFSFTGPEFNKETRVVSSTFVINTGSTSTVLLNVTLLDALGTTSVCETSLLSSSGTITCTVPSSFGNSSIVATLYQDGVKKVSAIFNVDQSPSDVYGNNLVWVALVIFFSFLGIGMSGNPIISGVFLIIGAVVLIALNVVNSTGFIGPSATILWFIIAVVIIIIKGANRQ